MGVQITIETTLEPKVARYMRVVQRGVGTCPQFGGLQVDRMEHLFRNPFYWTVKLTNNTGYGNLLATRYFGLEPGGEVITGVGGSAPSYPYFTVQGCDVAHPIDNTPPAGDALKDLYGDEASLVECNTPSGPQYELIDHLVTAPRWEIAGSLAKFYDEGVQLAEFPIDPAWLTTVEAVYYGATESADTNSTYYHGVSYFETGGVVLFTASPLFSGGCMSHVACKKMGDGLLTINGADYPWTDGGEFDYTWTWPECNACLDPEAEPAPPFELPDLSVASPHYRVGPWTSLPLLGDNVVRTAVGTEFLARSTDNGTAIYRRPGYDEEFGHVIEVLDAGGNEVPPLGASAGDRYVVRQARTAAQVSEDLGTTFASVDAGEADPQVAALRDETELIALSADQPDGLMCGVRLSAGQLVAVDADGDTEPVASVSGGAQAVVFRGGDGTWEIAALDAGTLRSFVSAGVAARGWSQTASQALGAAAAGLTRMVGWRSRGGLDLLCGHHPTDGVYRVWYRPGAGQAWQGPGLELPSLVAYPPYLYERPTGQIEFGYYDGAVWTRRVADHPAGTWSAP